MQTSVTQLRCGTDDHLELRGSQTSTRHTHPGHVTVGRRVQAHRPRAPVVGATAVGGGGGGQHGAEHTHRP